MDAEEFARDTPPRQRKSRLQKFKDEIRALKQRGYTDSQIRDWLAKNDVIVSRENVRKFIKRHLFGAKQIPHDTPTASDTENLPSPRPGLQRPTITSNDNGNPESQTERLRRFAREQRETSERTQFKHDKTGNNH